MKPSDYVELHYSTYAVPFPRRNLHNFPSLIQKLAKAKESSILAVPKAPMPIFLALHSYLYTFEYSPSLKPVTSAPSTFGGKAGPPVIEALKSGEPPYLLTDIQVYALASKMAFAELRAKALARLYAQSMTRNDPMAALEKIYQGKDIEVEEDKQALRSWARSFLSRSHSDGQATNMEILQKSEQWKSRFAALRLKGGEFLADCDVANEGIAFKTAFMKIVGDAKHGTHKNDSPRATAASAAEAKPYSHHLQSPFAVPNSTPPLDLDINHFDLFGLPSLDKISRAPSPQHSDSPGSSWPSFPPSALHHLRGYYPGWPYRHGETHGIPGQ